MIKHVLACGVAWAMLTAAMTPADCARASRLAPAKACVVNPHGVVLAPNRAEAERLAGLARGGEALFARYFGGPPVTYAVVQDAPAGIVPALGKAGFGSVLPWLTDAQLETGVVASLRRGAEAQARAAGVTGDVVTRTADASVADWRAKNTGEARAKQEAGVVPHEAGHGWYIARYWPGARIDGAGHYGGPGPDWMDETAAVLMEGEGFAAERRSQFERIYKGTAKGPVLGGVPVRDLIDLPLFLRREHPAKGLLNSMATPVAGASGIRILAGAEALEAARGAILFYLQSRVFADYLIERTGKPAIFGTLGAAFGRGETMDAWIARHGRAHRLPGSVAALDADWRQWLTGRYGVPALKPVPTPAGPNPSGPNPSGTAS